VTTIRDVARAAGVSIATVSRVFNGSPRVSDGARQRVRSAATRLDYWPNTAARSLTTSRTHALGVLLPDLFGEFFSEVIRGIDHAARREHFQVLVSSSHADTADLVAAAQSMRGRIDGLIAMVPERGNVAGVRRLSQRYPVVLLNPPAGLKGFRTVSIANYDGAHTMVRHLVELGHRRIAIVKGPTGNIDSEERLRGYRTALRDAEIPVDPTLEVRGDFTESSGYQAADALLRLEPRPTAVFATNDSMAVGLLCALRDAEIVVPRDVTVAGFDDIEIARYMSPALTTVHVDAYQLGERAFRSLIQLIKSPSSRQPGHEILPTTLVLRSSCDSPRALAARQPGNGHLIGASAKQPKTRATRRAAGRHVQ
jgi:LacI family transcriptional regulator